MATATTPTQAIDPRLAILLEGYPDYQNFRASDLKKLSDTELRIILGSNATKNAPEAFIPRAFVRQYGDDAAGEFALAVEREASRRGKPELFATGVLNGGIGNAAYQLNPKVKPINSDVPVVFTLSDGTSHVTTAPRAFNHQIANDIALQMAHNEAARQQGTYTPQPSINVDVPQEVVAAVVNANSDKGVPVSLAKQGFSSTIGDEAAFFAGYAAKAVSPSEIGKVELNHPTSSFCNLDRGVSRIFNTNRPDLDAALAWSVGYMQREMDEMPAAQRTALLASCQKPGSIAR